MHSRAEEKKKKERKEGAGERKKKKEKKKKKKRKKGAPLRLLSKSPGSGGVAGKENITPPTLRSLARCAALST